MGKDKIAKAMVKDWVEGMLEERHSIQELEARPQHGRAKAVGRDTGVEETEKMDGGCNRRGEEKDSGLAKEGW